MARMAERTKMPQRAGVTCPCSGPTLLCHVVLIKTKPPRLGDRDRDRTLRSSWLGMAGARWGGEAARGRCGEAEVGGRWAWAMGEAAQG